MESLKEVFVKKCSDYACEPIPSLVKALCQGKTLSSLNLRGSNKELFNGRISAMQVLALCEALYEDTHIIHLDLSYNFLNDMAAQAIARLIKMNSHLKVVSLAGNDITAAGAASLAEVLGQQTSGTGLQGLVLKGNALGDTGGIAMADMLRTNKSLKLLDLADTHLGVQGVIALATALNDGNNTLQVLDLEAPQYKGPQDMTVLHLARMLAANTSLRELDLAKHGLTDNQLETLVTYGLLRNTTITSLNLRANKLSAFAAPELERILNECGKLEVLNLAHNPIGSDGGVALARSLPYCHWLGELDLRGCNMGDAGLVALAEALPLAQSLKQILVWGNAFGPGPCRAFHTALSHPGVSQLLIDIKAYEVDGEAGVALQDC